MLNIIYVMNEKEDLYFEFFLYMVKKKNVLRMNNRICGNSTSDIYTHFISQQNLAVCIIAAAYIKKEIS